MKKTIDELMLKRNNMYSQIRTNFNDLSSISIGVNSLFERLEENESEHGLILLSDYWNNKYFSSDDFSKHIEQLKFLKEKKTGKIDYLYRTIGRIKLHKRLKKINKYFPTSDYFFCKKTNKKNRSSDSVIEVLNQYCATRLLDKNNNRVFYIFLPSILSGETRSFFGVQEIDNIESIIEFLKENFIINYEK